MWDIQKSGKNIAVIDVIPKNDTGKTLQLFCFTFAGGTAAFFDVLENSCKGVIGFIKLEYSGHGMRHKEPLCGDFHEVSQDLYRVIKERYSGGEYALFGYSMGSIAVVEMLQYILKKNELPQPKHIFLAAHGPKAIVDLQSYSPANLDEYVKMRTIQFGGIPKQLLDNKSFWRMYLPLYKADYLMISRYDFKNLQFTTNIPATVFFSDKDTPRVDIEQWNKYFIDRFELIEYTGSHFFINEHYEEMADVIKERCKS